MIEEYIEFLTMAEAFAREQTATLEEKLKTLKEMQPFPDEYSDLYITYTSNYRKAFYKYIETFIKLKDLKIDTNNKSEMMGEVWEWFLYL